jgi:NADH-quinone oxidoreductase subunit M
MELTPWNPKLGSYYALGVDGIALLLVLLTALLSIYRHFSLL